MLNYFNTAPSSDEDVCIDDIPEYHLASIPLNVTPMNSLDQSNTYFVLMSTLNMKYHYISAKCVMTFPVVFEPTSDLGLISFELLGFLHIENLRWFHPLLLGITTHVLIKFHCDGTWSMAENRVAGREWVTYEATGICVCGQCLWRNAEREKQKKELEEQVRLHKEAREKRDRDGGDYSPYPNMVQDANPSMWW